MPVADEMARRLNAWLGIVLLHMIGVPGDPERPPWTIAKPKDWSQHSNVNLLGTMAPMLSRSRHRLCQNLQDWCAAARQAERQGGNP
jgi:predicted phosphoribosyltransferase